MDICTFETAKKLKAAGFTEPKHTFGQFWYSRTCEPWVIGRLAPNAECVAISITDTRWDHIWDTVGFVFAPTATDILNELEGFFLSPMVGGGWGVFKVGTRAMLGFHSENPAEACAEAYLSVACFIAQPIDYQPQKNYFHSPVKITAKIFCGMI